jgi:hypothetical protein
MFPTLSSESHWNIPLLRPTSLIFLVLVLCAASMGYGVKLEFFDVQPEGRDFSIKWQMEVEEQVREYELTRKTPYSNEQFVKVQAFPAHGVGVPYEFQDDQVYKSGAERLDYRLEAVYDNGIREVIVTQSLNYTSTAIRRTWGSIKAMFQ